VQRREELVGESELSPAISSLLCKMSQKSPIRYANYVSFFQKRKKPASFPASLGFLILPLQMKKN
jgi:hypothetical protein